MVEEVQPATSPTDTFSSSGKKRARQEQAKQIDFFSQPIQSATTRDIADIYELPQSRSQPEPVQATAATGSAMKRLPVISTEITEIKAAGAANKKVAVVCDSTAVSSPKRYKISSRNRVDQAQSSERQSYLEIFDRILQTVMQNEMHLFSKVEQQTLEAFSKLDHHSRHLYTRIFMRKQAWLRVSGLNYGEQVIMEHSCRLLSAQTSGSEPFLITGEALDSCEDAISLLLLPELKTMARAKGIKQATSKTKEALCAAIIKTTKQRTVTSFFRKSKSDSAQQRQTELIQQVLKITGPLVRLHPGTADLFERVHMVFFRSATHLGDNNTMRSAVLANIGQIRFPRYEVARSSDLFASRDDVVRYKALVEVGYKMEVLLTSLVKETEQHRQGWELYLEHRQEWHTLLKYLKQQPAANNCGIEQMSLDYWRRHFTPGWALVRIVERAARFAANLKQFADERDVLESLLSQDSYRLSKRGDWYERLVLLYTTYLKPKQVKGKGAAQDQQQQHLYQARDMCIRALNDVHVNRVSLHAISRQLHIIEDKLGLPVDQQVSHSRLCVEWQPVQERVFYGMRIRNGMRRGPSVWDGHDGVPCSVEQLALWRYRELGYTGVHSENAMVTTLFGLLFWDIIFYPLPGVLDTEYQSQPLDMGSESFYFSRRTMIEQRLAEINDTDCYGQIISKVYAREHGSECVGISWDLSCEQLLTVAKHMGGKRLAAICRVLATEYRLKRSGFPDLCLWNESTGSVLFAEVKGPKDKLSETQRDWLDILTSQNIDVEVCHIREGDARDYEDH
ncbi:hypothetical protein IWW36_000319 [Coemansia brasiliensis]|uniref:Fanconi-associated nuclease n=1 Tax=Coemansia brasiliensis TaxID=2650707 RepID=A0A9W8IHP0_9FUNG|nr:hypothetical protein IWW36_000319 [Coemansia brasiliensis]